jgi:hypothetical protein
MRMVALGRSDILARGIFLPLLEREAVVFIV